MFTQKGSDIALDEDSKVKLLLEGRNSREDGELNKDTTSIQVLGNFASLFLKFV